MKSFCASLVAAALVSLVGCESHSTPGGPGATKPPGTSSTNPSTPPTSSTTPSTREGRDTASNRTVSRADETFTLSVPTLSTKVKQGETKDVTIGIKRGKNFDQDVTLKFSGLPQGVMIEPATAMVKHGDNDAKLKIHASDTAAVGDFTIAVIGQPATGANATNDFKVTVSKK